MAILNYTTTIDAFKSASEIEYVLIKHKAKSIVKEFEGERITGLSFMIDTGSSQIPIKLPVKVNECMKILREQRKTNKAVKDTADQAERVAWRILLDWVKAQMALLDIEMVQMQEIFMPYIVDSSGRTLYERLEEQQFLLLE